MAEIICPSCAQRATLPTASVSDAVCTGCGAALAFARRYVVTGAPLGDLGVDTADAAAPLCEGLDLQSGDQVLIRTDTVGDTGRLDREARILRGLSVRGVPTLIDDQSVAGVGRALVFNHPRTVTLERAIERGLRTDDAGGTRFLRALLHVLRDLHALSPPVFHRHVSPQTVFFDASGTGGRTDVTLVDFARATDVNEDADSDPVVARAGYAPKERVDPVALDLYGAAATTVHLLTRTPLDKLPHDDDGRPRFREAANVSAHLASVLERMLDGNGRARFLSADEALTALSVRPTTTRTPAVLPLALAAGGMLMLAGVAAGGLYFGLRSTSPVVIDVPLTFSPPPPPTARPVLPAPVSPAAVDPGPQEEVPAPPDAPMRKPPPRAAPKPIAPTPPSDQARIDALRRAVEAKGADLQACARDDDDRWRFTGDASGAGTFTEVRARDKARAPSTVCAARVLKAVAFANKSGRAFTSEITVYLRPSFRVTVF